jgi:hypothetical protein
MISARTPTPSSHCILSLPSPFDADVLIDTANPVGGHYDKAKTVSENLKMSPALLSRFDLVFILLDEVGVWLNFDSKACVLDEGC